MQKPKRNCTNCGSEFTPKRPWQTQCHKRCRQQAWLKRVELKEQQQAYFGA